MMSVLVSPDAQPKTRLDAGDPRKQKRGNGESETEKGDKSIYGCIIINDVL